jgi:Ca2+-binding RTX toxin-like protein
MATYTVTTSNWNSAAFWSGINQGTSGHTLDFSGLGAGFAVTYDTDADAVTISDGATSFVIGDVNYTGTADATLGGTTVWDNFTILNFGDAGYRIAGGFNGEVITTGLGNDTVFGNAGNDSITAGDGNNVVYGGTDNDTILTGAGEDQIFGEAGNDSINAGDANDFIDGGNGHDYLVGGAGRDQIEGGWNDAGFDTIFAGTGNDLIFGGLGNDQIWGEAGEDWRFGAKRAKTGSMQAAMRTLFRLAVRQTELSVTPVTTRYLAATATTS